MRSLSPEESALWARVTATIAPLSREKAKNEPAEVKQEPASAKSIVQLPPAKRNGPTHMVRKGVGTTLDGTWDRRLRSGAIDPDRVLDLHGFNLDGAWLAIDRALEQAIVRGDRVLLLITGHHRAGEPPIQRGRIRAAVNDWLGASRHAGKIAAVRGAHRRHGGGGSLYIVLRRQAGRR